MRFERIREKENGQARRKRMLAQNPIIQFIFITLLLFAYFTPALIAFSRNHKNGTSIFLTNLFFGWTFLGWAVALIWSASANVEVQGAPVQ